MFADIIISRIPGAGLRQSLSGIPVLKEAVIANHWQPPSMYAYIHSHCCIILGLVVEQAKVYKEDYQDLPKQEVEE